MLNTAVILAAGLGTRMGNVVKNKPKGFIDIGGKAIVQQSIEKLIAVGIEHIFIGTGYLSEVYENLMNDYIQIRCIKSEKFSHTGSMYTLYNMRNEINTDFLLLESDILYEMRGLHVLLEHNCSDVILSSGRTHSGDEVFIETDSANNLVNMSKLSQELNNIYSELVGISKISIPTYKEMCLFAETQFASKPKIDYEDAMVGISKLGGKIYIERISDFLWCEIDDYFHYNRAINLIYPAIVEKERTYANI